MSDILKDIALVCLSISTFAGYFTTKHMKQDIHNLKRRINQIESRLIYRPNCKSTVVKNPENKRQTSHGAQL